MRLNKFIALSTGMSRRTADNVIAEGRILIDGSVGQLGQQIDPAHDAIQLDGKPLEAPKQSLTIMLHKPVGYVCSRDGQGSKTIYDLLPARYHVLKPIGRLDKDSSGLLLLTNDGSLAYELSHPSFQKEKTYKIKLNRGLSEPDFAATAKGIKLDDGSSNLSLEPTGSNRTKWIVTMQEGRNRQIRRTFEALGYTVVELHRTHFGSYTLGDLKIGECKEV